MYYMCILKCTHQGLSFSYLPNLFSFIFVGKIVIYEEKSICNTRDYQGKEYRTQKKIKILPGGLFPSIDRAII